MTAHWTSREVVLQRELMDTLSAPMWRGKPRESASQHAERMAKRSLVHVELAQIILSRGLDSFRPSIVFEKPGHLPQEDATLAWHLRTAALPRAPKSSKEIASDWYAWRNLLLDAEGTDQGSALLMLRQIHRCEEARSPEALGYARTFRAFMSMHYPRAPIPTPLEPEPWSRLLHTLTRRREAVADWLLWFPSVGRAPKLKPPASVTDPIPHNHNEPEERDDEQSDIPF